MNVYVAFLFWSLAERNTINVKSNYSEIRQKHFLIELFKIVFNLIKK